jgi:hypothetical protein
MLSEQEKHQFFTMLSQGLMQYLLPSLQQISQQVIQQSVSAAQRSTPNFWMTQVVVQRTADEDSPAEFENKPTNPAQLLAEIADLLIDLNQNMEDMGGDIQKMGVSIEKLKAQRRGRKRDG